MEAPLELEITLARPAAPASTEPEDPVFARIRLKPKPGLAMRPRLELCFVLDASASMHRFVLEPEQRAYWQQRAEQRGEVTRQIADGRTGMVWTGETLREMQRHVSTPMISTLRGVWKTLEGLQPSDGVSVLAFADQPGVIYQDNGVEQRSVRLESARQCLTRLGSGVDESGLGRGTRLAGALQQALDRMSTEETVPTLRRMVMVSDGIIEDREACRPLLDLAVNRGIVISVIGVGDDFDEEFLMMIADLARGNYYYAATAPEVEQAVNEELNVVSSVVGRQGHLRLRPENGAIVHDLYPVAPQLSEFQAMWVEDGAWRFRIGDISAAQPPEFLLELAAPAHGPGELRLCTVQVEGQAAGESDYFGVENSVRLFYSDEVMLLQARDDEVLDLCRRLEVYRAERRAAEAEGRGDTETATKQLKAATRMLRNMGADSLADEMDAAASEAEAGTRNLGRTKRVKAGTRRLTTRQQG
jgi:hypothetical protein